MSEMKTAPMHNLEHGVQPLQGTTTPGRAAISELKKLSPTRLVAQLVEDGYFSSDRELEDLLRSKL